MPGRAGKRCDAKVRKQPRCCIVSRALSQMERNTLKRGHRTRRFDAGKEKSVRLFAFGVPASAGSALLQASTSQMEGPVEAAPAPMNTLIFICAKAETC